MVVSANLIQTLLECETQDWASSSAYESLSCTHVVPMVIQYQLRGKPGDDRQTWL